MRRLIAFSIRRPIAISMLYAAIGVLAMAVWSSIEIGIAPSRELAELSVTATWTGAPPAAIQSLVTAPIESIAATVPGIRQIRSSTRRGQCIVLLRVAAEADVDLVHLELGDRLALLQSRLPREVPLPTLSRHAAEALQTFQGNHLLVFSMRGPGTRSLLRRLAIRTMVPALSFDGIRQIRVSGGGEAKLRIDLDPARAEWLDVRPTTVRRVITDLGRSWSLGSLQLAGTAYSVRVEHTIDDLKALSELHLGTNASAPRVGDVADARIAFEDINSDSRIDGQPAVHVALERQPGSDLMDVGRRARVILRQIGETLPPGVHLDILHDQAADIETEFAGVTRRFTLMLMFLALVLIVTLRDARGVAFLLLSLAASTAITVVALYQFGGTMSVLTLTGLAVAFGLIVDNAIVVWENCLRLREQGVAPQAAAERGTLEVLPPLLTSTLTTLGAILPLLYLEDRLRDTFQSAALAAALALSASMIVALSWMPMLLAQRVSVGPPCHSRGGVDRYRMLVRFALRHRGWFLAVAAATLIARLALLYQRVPLGGLAPWWSPREALMVRISLPTTAPAAAAEETIRPFEEYALGLDHVERVEMLVHHQQAYLTIRFATMVERTRYPLEVKSRLVGMAAGRAGVGISIYGFNSADNYHNRSANRVLLSSGIHLFGHDYRRLEAIAEDIARTARRSPRVRQAAVTSELPASPTHSELLLRLRRDRVVDHGGDMESVMDQLHSLLEARWYRDALPIDGSDVGVAIRRRGVEHRSHGDLMRAPVAMTSAVTDTDSRPRTRLAELVQVERQGVPAVITREDQTYDRWVRWEYRGSPGAAAGYQTAMFEGLQLPAGFRAEIDEPDSLSGAELSRIRTVALLALLVNFIVLVALYESILQPLIVLLSVPMALIGVCCCFLLTGRPFDASAIVGVVMMSGIVVNNAILMVQRINHHRQTQRDLAAAIIAAAPERLRPILITSATTIGSLLPMAVLATRQEGSIEHDGWSNLALSMVGGIAASTLFTLILTPVLLHVSATAAVRLGDLTVTVLGSRGRSD